MEHILSLFIETLSKIIISQLSVFGIMSALALLIGGIVCYKLAKENKNE